MEAGRSTLSPYDASVTPIKMPSQLRDLLSGSPFEAATIELAQATGLLVQDNGTPFFPAYTDHATQHVEHVLDAAVRLIPDEVWSAELLQPADAAVLGGAAMLHDLALHIREVGFVELVAASTNYNPQPWFSTEQVGRIADIGWPQLWESFQYEARHFGTSQLELILGPGCNGVPLVAHDETLRPESWTKADRLLIGEFLRRHHARLSHEIAMHGFPGATPDDFPVLARSLAPLANAVGAVARSHNEPLRSMLDYLEYLDPGSKRPAGALLAYHMGLLRVADYLQVQSDRAPPLLLRLKAPQSPASIEEWNKHGAIASIVWEHRDPRAIYVAASQHHGLRTHLALRELFDGLQREFDTTTAVLGDIFHADTRAAAPDKAPGSDEP